MDIIKKQVERESSISKNHLASAGRRGQPSVGFSSGDEITYGAAERHFRY